MNDQMSDAATETSAQVVARPKQLSAEPTSTQVTSAGGAGAAAALSGLTARSAAAGSSDDSAATSVNAQRLFFTGQPEQPPPPPLQAVLESRVVANARAAPPREPEPSVDFAPWAMNATVNSAASAGVIAARPVVPPPSFLVQIDSAKADELRKIIAALTGQSKKNFTIDSLIGAAPSESILSTLSVRRVTTANVAFSKRAQQLTANRDEPALCLLRLERAERLLEARVRIRQSRTGAAAPFATLELTATAPTTLADDIQAFEELRAALATLWGAKT